MYVGFFADPLPGRGLPSPASARGPGKVKGDLSVPSRMGAGWGFPTPRTCGRRGLVPHGRGAGSLQGCPHSGGLRSPTWACRSDAGKVCASSATAKIAERGFVQGLLVCASSTIVKSRPGASVPRSRPVSFGKTGEAPPGRAGPATAPARGLPFSCYTRGFAGTGAVAVPSETFLVAHEALPKKVLRRASLRSIPDGCGSG